MILKIDDVIAPDDYWVLLLKMFKKYMLIFIIRFIYIIFCHFFLLSVNIMPTVISGYLAVLFLTS